MTRRRPVRPLEPHNQAARHGRAAAATRAVAGAPMPMTGRAAQATAAARRRAAAALVLLLSLVAASAPAAVQAPVPDDGRGVITAADGAEVTQIPDVPTPVEQAAAQAAEAAAQLRTALGQLDHALSADDQVVALTAVIRAYEQGQGALRDSLRRAALREAQVRADFDARRERLSRVIGVMASMEQSPETLMLLHPGGPNSTAQSGMILSAVAPALETEAQQLKSGLDEIAAVRKIEQNAADTLAQGLGQVQQARRMLASAVTDRSAMPARFSDNPEEVRALIRSAETLDAFANGIVGMEQDIGAPTADFEGAQGSLPLPAVGEIARRYREADAAGVKRPGIVIATAPAALVTAPWPATIRYRGPLLDYGNVMIVEPSRGYLLVLAGLAQVFGEPGDVLAAGEPLGLMGGTEGSPAEFAAGFVANAAQSAVQANAPPGAAPGDSQRLYVELRHGKETLDPADWFVMNPVVGLPPQAVGGQPANNGAGSTGAAGTAAAEQTTDTPAGGATQVGTTR